MNLTRGLRDYLDAFQMKGLRQIMKKDTTWAQKKLGQDMTNKNNERENSKRIAYNYQEGQKVLIKTEQSRKYGKNPYEGPYEVIEVRKRCEK